MLLSFCVLGWLVRTAARCGKRLELAHAANVSQKEVRLAGCGYARLGCARHTGERLGSFANPFALSAGEPGIPGPIGPDDDPDAMRARARGREDGARNVGAECRGGAQAPCHCAAGGGRRAGGEETEIASRALPCRSGDRSRGCQHNPRKQLKGGPAVLPPYRAPTFFRGSRCSRGLAPANALCTVARHDHSPHRER